MLRQAVTVSVVCDFSPTPESLFFFLESGNLEDQEKYGKIYGII
jgi:hypothetical protein